MGASESQCASCSQSDGEDPRKQPIPCAAEDCGPRGVDKAKTHCVSEMDRRLNDNPYDDVLPLEGQFQYYDDEVKPAKWGLSEYQEWKAEHKEPSWVRDAIAEWRDLKDLYDYDEEDVVTIGAYGACFRAHCKTLGVMRSVKRLSKSVPSHINWGKDEVKVLKRFNHPNVITLVQTVEDHRNLYFVIDLCEGGSLSDYMKQDGVFQNHLTELETLLVMSQILEAVRYIHKQRFCHRNLTLEKFLFLAREPIETATLKMVDFSSAGFISLTDGHENFFRKRVGTIHFIAPEVLKEQYTHKCDLWSCGVIMHVCICGSYPFMGDTAHMGDIEKAIEYQVLHGNFSTQGGRFGHVTEEAKTLLRGLLKHNYHERFTAERALASTAIVHATTRVYGAPPVLDPLISELKTSRPLNWVKDVDAYRRLFGMV